MRVKFGDHKNLVANISVYYVGVTKCKASKYAYPRTAAIQLENQRIPFEAHFLLS